MAGEDIIEMRLREVKRLRVIEEAIGKRITQQAASMMIGVTERQVRRIVKAVREEGARGIVHKSRGRVSKRKIGEGVKGKVMEIYREEYNGFGPTLATEKLLAIAGIKVSEETLRKWLIESGEWKRRRKHRMHRQWRERKECFGEMVQVDGSHHDWLEGRGADLVLMGYIDDATSHVLGRFYEYEGTIPAMDSFQCYVKENGLPQSVYLDRHTTYKSPKGLEEWEELAGIEKPMSQFERALNELGVEVIHAYSPQAKGRVERLFGTLQDRLVKEMRLRGIKTREEANRFLAEYLPWFNEKFSVSPANDTDVHIRLGPEVDLERYLCIKTERSVRNDNTITYKGRLYQIAERVNTKKVIVEERLDGSLRIVNQGVNLKYKEIAPRPKKRGEAKKVSGRKPPYKPSSNHPWRRQWQTPKQRIYSYG